MNEMIPALKNLRTNFNNKINEKSNSTVIIFDCFVLFEK